MTWHGNVVILVDKIWHVERHARGTDVVWMRSRPARTIAQWLVPDRVALMLVNAKWSFPLSSSTRPFILKRMSQTEIAILAPHTLIPGYHP